MRMLVTFAQLLHVLVYTWATLLVSNDKNIQTSTPVYFVSIMDSTVSLTIDWIQSDMLMSLS